MNGFVSIRKRKLSFHCLAGSINFIQKLIQSENNSITSNYNLMNLHNFHFHSQFFFRFFVEFYNFIFQISIGQKRFPLTLCVRSSTFFNKSSNVFNRLLYCPHVGH